MSGAAERRSGTPRGGWAGWLLAAIIGTVGALLTVGGGWLASLGGSLWYLGAGLVCLAVAVCAIRAPRAACVLYALFLVASILWALGETGLAFWQLLPPLAGPAVVGLLFLLFSRQIGAWRWAAPVAALICFGTLGLAYAQSEYVPRQATTGPALIDNAAEASRNDWRAYGNSVGGTRFSSADEITPANVGELQLAWTYNTGETSAKRPDVKAPFSFQATPLMIDDTLAFCTPLGNVVALNPETGEPRWSFDPQVDPANAQLLNCRGVSYHEAEGDGPCAKRLLSTTMDGRLIALDLTTGQRCEGFGQNGEVSLREGMGPVDPLSSYTTSPAAVVGNVAILGAYVRDNVTSDDPSGVVRAFDVRTGDMLWAWDPGRPEDAGPLQEGETWTRGSPNAWSVFSADPQLGLVYLPMGNATPDHIGTHRDALDDRYGGAIVALDVETGAVRWSFNTVRHDIWDYDVPAQPSLLDWKAADGSIVPALAASTKRGVIFLLDRRTGQPLLPLEQRPAPQGNIPGEAYAATQPYQPDFPSLAPAPLEERQMWGATPLDRLWCRIRYRSFDYEGDFTPPSTKGALQYPGNFGVLNWGGASIDPNRGLLVVNSSTMPQEVRLISRSELQDIAGQQSHGGGVLPQGGTDYAVSLRPMLSPLGVPCHAPPWGQLTAISLADRKIAWQRPLGTTADIAPAGIAMPGVFSIGGPVTTRSGLTFIAGTLDDYLRAFDSDTGKELWRGRLPAGGQATPMTYKSLRNGRQYVVIAAGGHGAFGTTPGDALVAFALPERR